MLSYVQWKKKTTTKQNKKKKKADNPFKRYVRVATAKAGALLGSITPYFFFKGGCTQDIYSVAELSAKWQSIQWFITRPHALTKRFLQKAVVTKRRV